MKHLFLFLLACLPFIGAAQDNVEAHGDLLYYTQDKILHVKIHSGHLPIKGQIVTVDKSFQLGKMKGTHSLAEGTVIGGSNKDLQIQVSQYTSTVTRDGEQHPMCEKGDELIIQWPASKEDLARAHFDEDVVKAKTAFIHYEYESAIELFDKLIKIDDHCLDCYYVRGRCHMAMYQEDKAIEDFNKVIELHADEVLGIEKAYQYRAMAHFNLGDDEKAIADYDKLLTLNLKSDEIVFLLKKKLEIYSDEEVSHKYDHKEAYEHACECVEKIKALEGDNLENDGLKNKHCGKEHPAEKAESRTDFVVVSQSESGYELVVKVKQEAGNCYDFHKLPYSSKIKKGLIGSTHTCSEGSAMSIAAIKVAAIKGDLITLKVLYWSNTMNGEFIVQEFKEGDSFMAWW